MVSVTNVFGATSSIRPEMVIIEDVVVMPLTPLMVTPQSGDILRFFTGIRKAKRRNPVKEGLGTCRKPENRVHSEPLYQIQCWLSITGHANTEGKHRFQ